MPDYFLDTSAIVKRYVPETGHAWVRSICRAKLGQTIVISEAAIVEVVASLCRMARDSAPAVVGGP